MCRTATRGGIQVRVQRMELLQLKRIARSRWPGKAAKQQAHNATNISALGINSKSAKDRKWHKPQSYLNKAQSKGRGCTAEGTARELWPLSLLLFVLLVCACVWACFARCCVRPVFLRIQFEIIEEFCHFGSIWFAQGGRAPINHRRVSHGVLVAALSLNLFCHIFIHV